MTISRAAATPSQRQKAAHDMCAAVSGSVVASIMKTVVGGKKISCVRYDLVGSKGLKTPFRWVGRAFVRPCFAFRTSARGRRRPPRRGLPRRRGAPWEPEARTASAPGNLRLGLLHSWPDPVHGGSAARRRAPGSHDAPNGGEGGIRTLGASRHTRFPSVLIRPL